MFFNKFISFYSRFLYQVQSFLLPPTCLLCGYFTQTLRNICEKCAQDLPILAQSCRQCAQVLTPATSSFRCGNCLKNSPPYDFSYALFPYKSPLIKLILNLKFQQQLSIANLFADLFLMQIKNNWYKNQKLPDLMLPIPLHYRRLKERGFNQAVEIGRPLAKKLGIPIDLFGLKRNKYTAPQSSLPAEKRAKNLAHAFITKRDYSGLTIAILDDVVTTGHTIQACAHALKQKGAKAIHVWCCARA